MGRKPKVPKLEEKAHTPETTKTYVLELELKPENSNPSSEKKGILAENTNPVLEGVEAQPKKQEPLAKSSSRNLTRNTDVMVRRSERLHNVVTNTQNHDLNHIIQEITFSDSEKEDEPADGKLLESTFDAKTMAEKVEYLTQLLQTQQETIDFLKSKLIKKTYVGESFGTGDVTYKGLYIDSQKKIEALSEENLQLTKKLENALGKIEVYEKGNYVPCEVLEKFKEVVLFSSLTKATEAAANVSSEAIRGAFNKLDTDIECKTSKRKKLSN